ncbi:hemin-degrading factor [Cerasicoccus fimbriatus]|uniref:hemin-degrading factor n=1 Tax=Cerasicoccus fimbriatus TaxID=3014554 RepID=UPI0022B39662|nr:ChuX/HutX family heme-like substrate-binding protein [Cerasicoccus sp. TK19100]
MSTSTPTLAERYAELKEAEPKLRMRDFADRLGVTECELVSADCGCESVRLNAESWIGFIEELKPLGRVMVLTRNDYCVHERKGCYEQISSHNGKIGLVVGKDIDLRFFFADWAFAFAVTAQSRGQEMKSIQFFDRYGVAIHKVYPKEESKMSVYDELVAKYRHEDQNPELAIETAPAKEAPQPVDEERKAKFLKGWEELKDTHDFFMLMAKNKVSRLQAMEIGEGKFTRRLENDAARRVLEQARDKEMPIMVFVGNDSAIQIHTGTVSKLVIFEDWFNVLDPDFNLHLKESGIASSWHVVKPTVDGDVNAVELYDAEGEIIAQFFGARKPGIPEREDWRELAAGL